MNDHERIGQHYFLETHGDLEISVVPLTFGRARIQIGPAGSYGWEYSY